MSKNRSLSRRQFSVATAATLSGISLQRSAAGEVPATDRITLGVIGLGSRGFNLIDDFLKLPECQIVAVCDVDEHHYRDNVPGKGKAYGRLPAKQHIDRAYQSTAGSGVDVYADFRQLIARDDIDAVVVATPDHWHAYCALSAIREGKDVYCEKPVTHLFAEGQKLVDAVAKRKTVFQTGSQQRSDELFQRVVALARNGVLGELQSVEVGLPAGYGKPMGATDILPPRETLDYDFWCGPSPVLPLRQATFHRWWRGHRAYGGGVLMDWIGHHNDIAHWAIGMERSGPLRIESVNWKFPENTIYNTPEQYEILCEYANGVKSSIASRHAQGLKVTGTDGWVYARRGKIEASDSAWLSPDFEPGHLQPTKPDHHALNFLRCIRSREECIAPAQIAHRSISPGHLGYVSWARQKALQWNPETETIHNDSEADRLLRSLDYRAPWNVADLDV